MAGFWRAAYQPISCPRSGALFAIPSRGNGGCEALRKVIGRGDPDRLIAVWHKLHVQPEAEGATTSVLALPPVVAERAQAATAEITAKLEELTGVLWQAAERLASQRVQGEAEAARAEAAGLRVQLDEAHGVLKTADEARSAVELEVERLAARLLEVEAAAAERVQLAERQAVIAEAAAAAARDEAQRVREDLRAALDAVGRVQARRGGEMHPPRSSPPSPGVLSDLPAGTS